MFDVRRPVTFLLDLPGATHPALSPSLLRLLPGRVECDDGPNSPLTTDLMRRYLREHPASSALGAELAELESRLVISRRPYPRYRNVASPEQLIVLLREPVTRLVALWEAAKHRGEFSGDLMAFATVNERRNVQSRFLRGVPLRRLAFLGFGDRPQSIELLCERLGTLPPSFARAHTLEAPGYQPTSAERSALEVCHADDVELYDRARRLHTRGEGTTRANPIEPLARRGRNARTPRRAQGRRAASVQRRHDGPYARGPLPLVAKEQKLALIFSAKAGCTFAVKWFFEQVGLLKEALSYSRWVHDYRQDVYYASERYQPGDIALPEMRIVKFVRNPFDRAVSSYVHANRFGYEDAGLQALLGRPVTKTRRYSFREFVRHLESIDVRACNIHHRLQLHPLEEARLVAPTHLVRIEESTTVLPALERELALCSADLNAINSSRHHTERSEGATFCGDEVFSFGSGAPRVPKTRAFYDAELERTIARLYRPDFAKYRYPDRLSP